MKNVFDVLRGGIDSTLLAGRRLYLAIWHLANGFPADAHLALLRALTTS